MYMFGNQLLKYFTYFSCEIERFHDRMRNKFRRIEQRR